MGPLTLKFDRATRPFLKIDKRHGACRHVKKYHRHYMALFLYFKVILGYFEIDMVIAKIMTGDIDIS